MHQFDFRCINNGPTSKGREGKEDGRGKEREGTGREFRGVNGWREGPYAHPLSQIPGYATVNNTVFKSMFSTNAIGIFRRGLNGVSTVQCA